MTTTPAETSHGTLWLMAMPGLFVVLWSTGFIGAKLGLPYAEPMTFLAIRFGIVAALLAALALATRAPWPASASEAGHLAVSGFLTHGVYLGAVFAAIYHGVEAWVVALVVGLQPLLVVLLAVLLLGERPTGRQRIGMAFGILGVALVVWTKLAADIGSPFGFALSFLAVIGFSFGMLYQKRFCGGMDLRSGNVIQYAAAALACALAAFLWEERQVTWSGEFIFAMVWLILVLSLGAISLYYLLIRRGAVTNVASLFFLVPPSTALFAWLLFDETFGLPALAGMVLAAIGVALVNLTPRPSQ